MKMDCGCNAHIVRLPQNQQFTNFDPRESISLSDIQRNEQCVRCTHFFSLLLP